MRFAGQNLVYVLQTVDKGNTGFACNSLQALVRWGHILP